MSIIIDWLKRNNMLVQIKSPVGNKSALLVTDGNINVDASVIEIINKWGEQIDVDTADAALGQIIWPIKATVQQYLFLDSPIQLFIRSTNPADTILGSGARNIIGEYHDLNGSIQDFDLETDGNNNVALPGTSVGVFRMTIGLTGASNTNEGQIQIVDGSANIYATIEIGEGQTQISVQRIPNDRTGTIKGHKVDYARTSASQNDASFRLKIRKPDGTIITKWDPIIGSGKTEDVKVYDKGGIDVDSGEWVYWECISVSANDTPLRGSFDIELSEVAP